jgi:predicted nucleic acid-binding protein
MVSKGLGPDYEIAIYTMIIVATMVARQAMLLVSNFPNPKRR